MSATDALPSVVSHIAHLQASVEAAEEAWQTARSQAAAHIESISARSKRARAAAHNLNEGLADASRLCRALKVDEGTLRRVARAVRDAVAALVSEHLLTPSAPRSEAVAMLGSRPGPEDVKDEEVSSIRMERGQVERLKCACNRLELRAAAVKSKLRDHHEAMRSGRERCGMSREDSESTALAGGDGCQAALAALCREGARLRAQDAATRRRTAGSRRRQAQFGAEVARLLEQVKAHNDMLMAEAGVSVPIPIGLLLGARST